MSAVEINIPSRESNMLSREFNIPGRNQICWAGNLIFLTGNKHVRRGN
jgi:hypothetical protein